MPQGDSRQWLRDQVRTLKEGQARVADGADLDGRQRAHEEWRQRVIDEATRDLLRDRRDR